MGVFDDLLGRGYGGAFEQQAREFAAHLRAQEAYMAQARAEMRGFNRVPDRPRPKPPPVREWWRNVLALPNGPFPGTLVKARYREMAKLAHPDRGGTNDEMILLGRAREEAMKLAK